MRSRRGDTLYILFTVLTILFILGMALSWVYQQQVAQVGQIGTRLQAHYVALAGIEKATSRVRSMLARDLVKHTNVHGKDEMEINDEVLGLLDPERAKEWARSYEYADAELVTGGSVKVVVEIVDVTKNEFFTHIDRVEKIPPGLEPYREKRDEEDNPVLGAQPLGGWSGRLKFTATGQYAGVRSVIEAVKDVKVIDLTPPAPDHTLFVHGKKTEYLKDGTFLLSNLVLPDQVLNLIHQLTLRMNEVLSISEVSRNPNMVLANVEAITRRLTLAAGEDDGAGAIKLVGELTEHVAKTGGDEKIKDMVDNIILSLNPRDWGRVRTNGVLQVYLPFFAPDDIINYFADSSIFGQQRPEIGYQNNYNRLHDPYLSVYTHYEGYIYKNYRRLNPLSLGPKPEPPQVVPPQRYTINTRMNYVLRYPEREPVPHLERLEKFAAKHATLNFKQPVSLVGTLSAPIQLEGIWYSKEEVKIGGYYKGRGLIISEVGITVTEDLKPVDDPEPAQVPGPATAAMQKTEPRSPHMLGLICFEGAVKLGKPVGNTEIEAGLYARDSVKGTKSNGIKLKGNLACENLNREQMPKWFIAKFNPALKNHTADNLLGSISKRLLSFRVLGDSAVVRTPKGTM
jgi:hypothetical protein